MLINAQRAEQLRVAIIDGPILKDYHIEIADRDLTRGNIYRGVVANIQPSLGAAFIDIGEERHGFLPAADVVAAAYHQKLPAKTRRPRVDQLLERGKPILVQVTKDGVGQKGAALHTNLALAGRYLVLTPYDDVRGISRKAVDDKKRKTIKDRLQKLNLPEGHGAIVRTNGLEQNMTTLNRDLSALLRLWRRVRGEANKGRGPRLLYSDQDLVVQALRDYLDNSIAEVLVDDDEVYEKAEAYMQAFMPRSKTRLIRYQERLPLFSRYRIETQVDSIYERIAPLPGGGSLVIDGTEALTAIDVNSGRATRTDDHDETILAVNMEAAVEVARQLRLRDIGGLVVVDFIDMRYRKHQSKLEKVMRDAMKDDNARYTVGKISPNGLLEINRQRIKQALQLRTHRPCPACQGGGSVATAEFSALNLLRRIEARAATGLFDGVTVALHPEIADALQNRHRRRLARLEEELEFKVEIVSSSSFRVSEDRFDWRERDTVPESLVKKSAAALSPTDLAIPERRRKQAKSEDAGEVKEAPKKRRRRRRKSAKTSEDEPVAAEAAEVQEAAEAEEKPSRSRRRRRGPRRKAKAAETGGGAPQKPSRGQPDGDAVAAPAEAANEASSAVEGSAPPSRSRRRRGSRRKIRVEEKEVAAPELFTPSDSEPSETLVPMDSDPLFGPPEETPETGPEPRAGKRRGGRRRTPRTAGKAASAAEAPARPFKKEDWYGPRTPPPRPEEREAAAAAAASGSATGLAEPAPEARTRPEAPSEEATWDRPSRRVRWQWFGGPDEDAQGQPRKDRGIFEPSSPAADDES